MAGIYCADIYCDDCIADLKSRLARQMWDSGEYSPDEVLVADFADFEEFCDHLECMNEWHYDSDEWPKYCDDNEESDCPQHCGSHGDCLNPTVLSNGDKVGHFFGNNLTTYGNDYVMEYVNDDLIDGRGDSVAVEVWMPHYDYLDYIQQCDYCGEYHITVDCEIPASGDYVLSPSGYLGCKTQVHVVDGNTLGEFDSEDSAIVAILEKMESEQFWPSIWSQNDRGDFSLHRDFSLD